MGLRAALVKWKASMLDCDCRHAGRSRIHVRNRGIVEGNGRAGHRVRLRGCQIVVADCPRDPASRCERMYVAAGESFEPLAVSELDVPSRWSMPTAGCVKDSKWTGPTSAHSATRAICASCMPARGSIRTKGHPASGVQGTRYAYTRAECCGLPDTPQVRSLRPMTAALTPGFSPGHSAMAPLNG